MWGKCLTLVCACVETCKVSCPALKVLDMLLLSKGLEWADRSTILLKVEQANNLLVCIVAVFGHDNSQFAYKIFSPK